MLFCLTAVLNFYFVTFLSGDKAQAVHAPNILVAGGGQIDPSGFHAGVSQHIRQLHHIPADLVKRPGKEVKLELSEGSTNGNQWMQCSIRTYTTEKWVIKAVKLELGAQQTLAHQDAEGSWVLNDPPPNKALELAKCQRYQYIANAVGNNIAHFGQGTTDSANSCVVIAMPIPEMRAFPAISSVGNFELSSAEDDHLPVTGISVYISSQSGFIWLMVKASGTLTKGRLYRLCAKSDKTARVILDANL